MRLFRFFLFLFLSIALTGSFIWGQSLEAIKHKAYEGDLDAQNLLGMSYERGEGIKLTDRSLLQISNEIKSKELLADLATLKDKTYADEATFLNELKRTLGETEASLFRKNILKYAEQEIQQNHEEAVFWYRSAAEAGHSDAQANLAKMYYHGRGIEKNNQKAFSWAESSAKQGNPKGLFLLGWMYRRGEGIKADDQRAAELYFQAADQGFIGAQNNLGAMYEYGQGIGRDTVKALLWYAAATKLGSKKALSNKKRIEFHHLAIRKLMKATGLIDKSPALLIPQYDQIFSQKEIRDLIEFYNTPLGKKYSQLQQQLAVMTNNIPTGEIPVQDTKKEMAPIPSAKDTTPLASEIPFIKQIKSITPATPVIEKVPTIPPKKTVVPQDSTDVKITPEPKEEEAVIEEQPNVDSSEEETMPAIVPEF